MAKNKALPPLTLPKGGSSTGGSNPRNTTPLVQIQTTETAPASFDHCARFCPPKEEAFKALAEGMALEGWELVTAVAHVKHLTTENGSGMSSGWMTFWKRVKRD